MIPPSGPVGKDGTLRGRFLLVLATLACLLPFAGKAVHIDDPLFVWVARRIAEQPSDFYGFRINWNGSELPMAEITKNPPLAGYYLAAAAALVGWRERALHLALLLPAVAAVLGSYALAASLCRHPGLAALVTLLCPVFVVSATNLMSDTLLLAFWVWALALWQRGLARRSAASLAGAAGLVALAALTKYFGASLIPLLFVQGLAQRRRVGAWALWLLLPLLVLAVYRWAALSLYGQSLVAEAGAYAGGFRSELGVPTWAWAVTALAFTGGSLATVAAFGPWCWSRRAIGVALAGVAAGLIVLVRVGGIGDFALVESGGIRWAVLLQLGLWLLAALGILGLAAADLRQRRDAGALLLGLWVLGTLAFVAFLNWTVSARTILPMAPAAAILLVRRLEQRGALAPVPRRQWTLAAPLAAGAALALAVAQADYALAGSARRAAARVQRLYGGGPGSPWFEGHWGFQYYLEAAGGRAVDWDSARPGPGDRLVIPSNNTNTFLISPEALSPEGTIAVPSSRRLATMNRRVGAGFYSDVYGGPLPFAFGRVPPERYYVFEVGSHFALARALLRAGRVTPAIEEYRSAAAKDPDDARPPYELGLIYQRQGRLSEAIEQYRTAVRLDPANPKARERLTAALAQQGGGRL